MKLERMKLESSDWSLKAWAEVGKWLMKLECFKLTWKESMKLESFQNRKKFSNSGRQFPTSLGSFQIKQKHSNLRLSNLKISNSTLFPSTPSNYTYPTLSIPVTNSPLAVDYTRNVEIMESLLTIANEFQ